MIRELQQNDIPQIVTLHYSLLDGFLSKLGKDFLMMFYTTSLSISTLRTFVFVEKKTIVGFITITPNSSTLFYNLFSKNPLNFSLAILIAIIKKPTVLFELFLLIFYPGFSKSNTEILSIAVSKQFQKKGLGKKLLLFAFSILKNEKIKQCFVSTDSKSPANHFYKKTGAKKGRSFRFLNREMQYYYYTF